MKLIHIIRYNLDAEYRRKVDSRRRFARIMAANRSIMAGIK
jgi:hypothetical protein